MLLLALWSAVYYSTFHPLAPEKGALAGWQPWRRRTLTRLPSLLLPSVSLL